MNDRINFIIEWNYNEVNSTLKFLNKFDFYKFYFVVDLIGAIDYKYQLNDEEEKLRNELWKRINYDAYTMALKYYNKDLPDWKVKTEQVYNHLIQALVTRLVKLVNLDFKKIIVPYFKEIGFELVERAIIDEKQGEDALLIINIGER